MARKFNDSIDLNSNELQNVVLQNLASPTDTGWPDGRIWYDTGLDAVRVRANGSTVSLASGMDADAIANIVGAMVTGNTETGITVTFEDVDNTLDFALDAEYLYDAVGTVLATNGTHTGITATIDDVGDGIDLAVAYGTVAAETSFGIASANGVASSASRSDHTHGTPANPVAYAAPALTLGTANAVGSASTLIRSDATILAFDATAPSTLAFGGAAAAGAATVAARRDHSHGVPANPVAYAAPAFTLGTANATGAAATLIRSDASLALFDATNPSTQAFSDAAAVGAAAFAARRDHKHAMPAHGVSQHQELIATADLTDWPRAAALDLNNQKITGLADGTAATDAATFGQLSGAVAGFDWKEPVRAMTDANVATLAGGAPSTTDGVTLAANDRVLVGTSQTTASTRGVYIVQTLGTGANGTWVRAGDMDAAAEVNKATVLVTEGTANRGDIYQQTATVATLGTDPQTWTKVSEGNQTYTADGTTITLSGSQFAITSGGVGATQLSTGVAGDGLAGGAGTALSVSTGAGIEISGDAVRIAAAAAGNGLTGGAGSALAVGQGTGIAVTADAVAVDRATNGSKVAMIYAAALTGGAATEAVTHGLGSRDVVAIVYGPSGTSYAEEEFSIEHTDANNILVRSATTIPATTYRVVVFG